VPSDLPGSCGAPKQVLAGLSSNRITGDDAQALEQRGVPEQTLQWIECFERIASGDLADPMHGTGGHLADEIRERVIAEFLQHRSSEFQQGAQYGRRRIRALGQHDKCARPVAVGVTATCPYGISVCWGGAYHASSRLHGVEMVGETPGALPPGFSDCRPLAPDAARPFSVTHQNIRIPTSVTELIVRSRG
jgi:hypothetical protein